MCSYVELSFILDLRWGGIKNPVQGRLSWEERVPEWRRDRKGKQGV